MALGEASTLSDLFLARVRASPHAPAYRQHTGQAWIDITWRDAEREVRRWRAALRKEELRPGDRVALCLRNRVEWVYFDQAALGLGLVVVPLYFNDRPDNMAFCLNDAGARLLLLEDGDLWPPLRDQVQTIERVVVLGGASGQNQKLVHVDAWLPGEGEALERGKAAPDDLATIVYTSGTTGRPKGVMLTHRNIVSNVHAALKAIPIHPTDRLLSFLPLSHMFERTPGYYLSLQAGAQTVYARGISLLAEDIREQRPSVFISVPRIFERIHAGLQAAMPAGSLKRRLFDKAVDIGWKRFNRNAAWHENLLWPLLRLLVADKLRRRFGGRLRLVVVGGAAFAPNLSRVFIGLGLPILQGYGLTETAPVLSVNRMQDNDPSSVGRALEGIELRCDAGCELLARGPNIMRGYWNNPQATAEVIDEDGWFHTGDLARIRDGRVYITGRLKEIIVLSSGEKIPPTDAEQAILADSGFEQVMVVGEGRAKLGLLAVSRIENEAELCARANKQLHGFPGYARIRHIARLSEPWTAENGLLTLTQKLKRKQIEERLAKEIEAMYQREDLCRNEN